MIYVPTIILFFSKRAKQKKEKDDLLMENQMLEEKVAHLMEELKSTKVCLMFVN